MGRVNLRQGLLVTLTLERGQGSDWFDCREGSQVRVTLKRGWGDPKERSRVRLTLKTG